MCNPEADQILVPEKSGLVQYNLLNLFGLSSRKRRSITGAGDGPFRYITQRGPYQDGETAVGLRYDPRTLQVVVAEQLGSDQTFWKRRDEIIDLLRPSRGFLGTDTEQMRRRWNRTDRLVYRRWLPGGDLVYGNDLITTAGSALVTCPSGRFVHYGLKEGTAFFILTDVWGEASNHGEYHVDQVVNDYTVRLNTTMNATRTGQNWMYRRSWAYRDLYCLLEAGPNFDQGPDAQPFYPTGYQEVLRFIAHDPYWYGEQQEQDWNLLIAAGNYGDLVFDGEGAWLGATPGEGRWVFIPGTVSGETGTIDLYYWGTAVAQPTIHLTGPMENFRIINATTRQYIALYYTLAGGEEVVIDVPSQSVYNNAYDILTPYAYGDIATFGLAPPPAAGPTRKNTVSVGFSGATVGTTNARITWRNTYVGI